MSNKSTAAAEKQRGGNAPWYLRILESGDGVDGENSLNIKTMVLIGAVVLAGVIGWQLFKSTQEASMDASVNQLTEAYLLLPDGQRPNAYDGGLGGLGMNYFIPEAGTSGRFDRGDRTSRYLEKDATSSYLGDLEAAIDDLAGKRSGFDKDRLWWLDNAAHQLHWYAALHSEKPSDALRHLEMQKEILATIESEHGDVPFFKMVGRGGKPLLTAWNELVDKEIAFFKEHQDLPGADADKNLVTIELDNGKTVEVETYSRVAPKTVANWLEHVKAGRYDGTAVHSVDKEAGTLECGDLFTKLAPDREFIWGTANVGYSLAAFEGSPRVPLVRGSLVMKRDGSVFNAMQFVIHTKDADQLTTSSLVFGKIVKGIEVFDDWLNTEVRTAEELGDKTTLPKVRLGLKSLKASGPQDHLSDDSWKPLFEEPKVPTVTPAEKKYTDALNKVPGEDDAKPEDADKIQDDDKKKAAAPSDDTKKSLKAGGK